MKKRMSKYTKWSWILTGFSAVLAVAGVMVLPDTIPVHFGPSGEPDGWGSSFFLFLYPVVLVFLHTLAGPMKKMDPKHRNYIYFDRYYDMFFMGMSIFFCIVQVANVAIAMGAAINVGAIICFAVGILMTFVGNMFPKIKQNHFFGLKLAWTISDEENWYKTHRFGGKCFVAAGILMMFIAFIPGESKAYMLVPVIALMALAPVVYSGIIYYKKHHSVS